MDVSLPSISFPMHISIETGQRFQSVPVTLHDIICTAIDGLRTAMSRQPWSRKMRFWTADEPQ